MEWSLLLGLVFQRGELFGRSLLWHVMNWLIFWVESWNLFTVSRKYISHLIPKNPPMTIHMNTCRPTYTHGLVQLAHFHRPCELESKNLDLQMDFWYENQRQDYVVTQGSYMCKVCYSSIPFPRVSNRVKCHKSPTFSTGEEQQTALYMKETSQGGNR